MSSSDKRYGLILSTKGKAPPAFQATRNVFGEDSDSDEERSKKSLLLRPSPNMNRQTKISQEKAVTEDPTVYQYDEIYDEMVGEKEKEKKKNKEEKKPRYIENLLKTASKRKIENERRIERQIQKEREKEGEEFKDKEVFVTSAYKKKLEEMRIEEEKEKREEYLESIGDVTKQKDLGGFYRHLYEQKLGSDKPKLESKSPSPKDDESKVELPSSNEKKDTEKSKNIKGNAETSSVSNESTDKEKAKRRNYRKRKSSDSKKHLSEGEIEESDEEINRFNLEEIKMAKKTKPDENIDADSDFSVDDPSSDDENEEMKEVALIKTEKKDLDPFAKPAIPKMSNEKENKSPEMSNEKENKSPKIKTEKKQEKEDVPKIDIWKKRTVGIAFDQALQRYYERKAARGY